MDNVVKPRVARVKFTPLTLKRNIAETNDYASLVWTSLMQERGSYPRVTVFTSNIKQEGAPVDYSAIISTQLSYTSLFTLSSLLEEAIATPNECKFQIQYYNNNYVNNVRTDEVTLQSTIVVGKDKDNILYIAVVADGKKRIKFEFGFSEWHKVIVNGESTMALADQSSRAATSYVRLLESLYSDQLLSDQPDAQTQPNGMERIRYSQLSLRQDYDDIQDHASLTWSILKHTKGTNPRVTVFTTNNRTEGAKMDYNTIITAPLTYTSLFTFVDLMKEVLTAANDTKFQLQCFNTKYENNVRTNEVILQAVLTVGKDADGIIYISATSEGKRAVEFKLGLTDRYKLFTDDGVEMSKANASLRAAKGYIKVIERIFSSYAKGEPTATSNVPTAHAGDAPEIVENDIF